MCGICGFQGTFKDGLIQRMMSLLAHRGPDDQGCLEDSNNHLALGHVRLSIVDLRPEARQPLTNEDHSIYLICNGEIYNYKELRNELIAKGHLFSSFSDSEVLLHLYEEEHIAMLDRLNGMFAFAIYDYKKNELFCARDQFGVKPFYYACDNNYFIFASELKALLSDPQISREIDPVAIHHYLTFLWSPSPTTMFKAIRKLESGFALIVKNGSIKHHWRYYDIPYNSADEICSEVECIERVQKTLEESVKRQLIGDVPVGAFLSGGLDSSAVVAMMKKAWPEKSQKCYTISFAEGKNYDGFVNDLPYARKAALHIDVDLNELVIEADIVNNIEKVIYFMDEPQADLAPINIMLICQKARQQGIKVLLSGAGGDDIFSGYRRHMALYFERYWSWLPSQIRCLIERRSQLVPASRPITRRIKRLFENASLDQDKRMIGYFFWIGQDKVKQLYSHDMYNQLIDYDPYAPMQNHLASLHNGVNKLNRLLYLECKTFLPDHNLNYTDKMSMASGIEVRVPLLDIDLVELSTKIPPYLKQNALTSKYILKKAMEPFLPREIIYRTKGAIAGPLRFWLLNDLKEMMHDVLSAERIKQRGWFNYKFVHELIKDNESMKVDASYPLWALVSMEIWANLFLDSSYTS